MSEEIVHVVNPEAEDIAPFRVVSKLKNNRLIRAREAVGFKNVGAAATFFKIEPSILSAYECFSMSPWSKKTGKWKKTAKKIATAYGMACEELWPDIIASVKSTALTFELNEAALHKMTALNTPEDTVSKVELTANTDKALGQLSKREEYIIRGRFGIGTEEKTSEEMAQHLGITRGRLLQIEDKALFILRGKGGWYYGKRPRVIETLAPYSEY